MFLLSSLGNLITKQHWNNILRWIFGNVLFNKDVNDISMVRAILRRRKSVRRRDSRHAKRIRIRKLYRCFNPTLGFPGEGWGLFKMATWNTRSLTFERFKYCENLDYDVLAITETWRKQSKYQSKSTRYTTSTPKIIQKGPRKGQARFPGDKAAGVGILLSKRAQQKLLSHGSEGERICWVRLKGPTCNLYIIAVYMPHRGRVQPCQDDTIKDLESVMATAPQCDCICLLGDLNEQLEGGVPGHTGKWTAGPKSANSDKMINFMRIHNLTAANTLFEPKAKDKTALHTFLQTKRGDTTEQGDMGEYVGDKVREKYKGIWYDGTVVAANGNGNQPWTAKFTDGYVKHYSKRQLEKILIHTEKVKSGKQLDRELDYVLISSRWKSCVRSCKPKWGPSIHRDLHGERNDHALVECVWAWRIRVKKTQARRDYSSLYKQEADGQGKPVANPTLVEFEAAVDTKLDELEYNATTDNTTAMYAKICAAINFAADTVLPSRRKGAGIKRDVSDKTKQLFERRKNMRNKGTKVQFQQVQAEIKTSSLEDFQSWVAKWAANISKAAGLGDTRKVYKGVNALAQKQSRPPTNLTTDKDGNTLKSAEETASVWHQFLTRKFAATEAEQGRPEMEQLPSTKGTGELTETQLKKGLARMGSNKACGADNIPTELYKSSDRCRALLFQLIQKIWTEEEVPVEFGKAMFLMLHKNKGSTNDPTKYRCLALLPHAYKVFHQCLLERIEDETQLFLSDWQAGFRKWRGCRDNILTLRTVYDQMLEQGKTLYTTFIDYSAAFDTVSHKYIDKALKKAGASNKSRAIFRAVYASASAVIKTASTDNEVVMSDPFPINRGVVQGDIMSPLYFILALELILREHDNIAGKGIQFGGINLHTLGYADDAALLDLSIEKATERVTSISKGSVLDADMVISVAKTEVMHVTEQDRVPPATTPELEDACKFVCPHIGCDRVFFNVHGCKCHAGKCRRKDWFAVEKILDVRGETGTNKREFLVRWKGYGPEEDQWEPRHHLHPTLIKEFLMANDFYDHFWQGARCSWCDKPCKNARGVKVHKRFCHMTPDQQNFKGTCADKKVKQNKLDQAQKSKAKVKCEHTELKNVFRFKYLGSIFAADGSTVHDVKRRIALAMSRMGELRHIFNSEISLDLKMKIYQTAVCSLLTYGCEAWTLDAKTTALINGANARCLSRFTGKDAHVEASVRTRSFDLVAAIKRRRFKWLGHLLRLQGNRIVKWALKVQHGQHYEGNMFHGMPDRLKFGQVALLAYDRKLWKRLGKQIGRSDTAARMLKAINNVLWSAKMLRRQKHPALKPGINTRSRMQAHALAVRSTQQQQSAAPAETGTQPTKQWPIFKKCAANKSSSNTKRHKNKKEKAKKTKKTKGQKEREKAILHKERMLTDKQRRALANAHYALHHGTVMDAAQLLRGSTANIPAAMMDKLAARVSEAAVPKWSVAEAELFSSSDDSSTGNSSCSYDISNSSSLMKLQSSPLPMQIVSKYRGEQNDNSSSDNTHQPPDIAALAASAFGIEARATTVHQPSAISATHRMAQPTAVYQPPDIAALAASAFGIEARATTVHQPSTISATHDSNKYDDSNMHGDSHYNTLKHDSDLYDSGIGDDSLHNDSTPTTPDTQTTSVPNRPSTQPTPTTTSQPAKLTSANSTTTQFPTADPPTSPVTLHIPITSHTPSPIALHSPITPNTPSPIALHTPTIHGHLYPAYTHSHNTHNTPTQLTLTPIQSITHKNIEWSQSPHTEWTQQTQLYKPYISILNDTYLVIHNHI